MLSEVHIDWSGVPVAAAFIVGFVLGVIALIFLARIVVDYVRGKG